MLEALVEAKEYMQQGIKIMERWFTGKSMKTYAGKKILVALEKEDIFWWTEKS